MMQRISRRAGLVAVVAAAEVVSVSPITRLKRDIRDISPVRRACRGTVAVAFCGFRDRKTAIFGGLLRLSGRTVAKAVIEVVAALLGKWIGAPVGRKYGLACGNCANCGNLRLEGGLRSFCSFRNGDPQFGDSLASGGAAARPWGY